MIALKALFSVYSNTMSVHLREEQPPMAKHGVPGQWHLQPINDETLTKEYLIDLADEIIEYASLQDNAFIEDEHEVVQVVQLENYRIVITYPPFSDAHEITIVRPTMKRDLHEYFLPQILLDRLEERAEGILIAGAPGHGKSTFAAALTSFYADKNQIIKTIEKPRDLQLDSRVTQFTMLQEDIEKVGDVLLLMRPDYVIFDEIRKNDDFSVYTDMRLAGMGMVGVIHATQPIDAVQRFVNRIELGLIPSIIDTVVFIKDGEVEDVLSLKMTVKTPSGFRDDSLARPVIEVNDFLDGIPRYEMFSFGEQVVVIPLNEGKKKKKRRGRKSRRSSRSFSLRDVLRDIVVAVDGLDLADTHIERGGDNAVNIYMPDWAITFLYDNRRQVIREVERNYNIFINFIAVDRDLEYTGKQIEIVENKKYLILKLGNDFKNQNVQLMIGPQVLMNATTDKQGNIKLSRNKANTKRLERMLDTADSPLTVKAV